MKHARCILTALLLLLTSLSALDVALYSDEKNPGVLVYSLPQSEQFRQVTLKADVLNLAVSGDNRKKIEVVIFARERKNGNPKNEADAYFAAYRKGSVALKEIKEGNPAKYLGKFFNFSTVDKDKELIFEYKGLQNNKFTTYALILLPANYASQLDVKIGNVSVENMASEILINNSAGNITLSNSRGVTGLNCKSGNMEISGFEGVINAGLLTGNIEVNKSEGDLSVKMSAGNCEIKNFLGKAKIINTVGNIEMSKIRKSDIQIKNSSGNIEITDLADCGNVKIANETGEISVANSSMKRLYIQASGGDIDLNKVDAVFRISSRAGDINLSAETLHLGEDNLIELDYGDIEINLKKRQGYDYYKNPSGDRQYNSNRSIEADSYLRIKNKNGQGKQFYINVDTGSIIVE